MHWAIFLADRERTNRHIFITCILVRQIEAFRAPYRFVCSGQGETQSLIGELIHVGLTSFIDSFFCKYSLCVDIL